MKGITETSFIISIGFFFGFLAFMMTIVPAEYQFINSFDFAYFGGSIIAIAGTCVVATGLPCAAALGIWGFVSIFEYIIVSGDWLKLLIFTPIVFSIIYVISRLARGGG